MCDLNPFFMGNYIREAVRNAINGYEVKALFSSKGRGDITAEILSKLKEKSEEKGGSRFKMSF